MTRIGAIADVHLGFGEPPATLSTLRSAAEHLAERGAERLFLLGDLILEAASAETDAERVDRVRATVESQGTPVTYLRGNHDVEHLSNGDLTALLESPPYGTATVADARIVHLNSATRRSLCGEIGRNGLDYLRRVLTDESADLLFVHHPIGHLDLSGNAWFAEEPERAVCGDKREASAILTATEGVDAVVSGHVHEPHHVRFAGTEHVTLGPFNRERPGAGLTGTYAEIDLGERIEITEWIDREVVRRQTIER